MKLAELIIQLSANTASLQRDFDKATRQAAEFADNVKSSLAGIGIGIGIGGIAEGIKNLVEYEHEMSDAAASTGMAVEQISGLSYALKSAGIPLNELQLGLAQFDKIISGLMRSKAGANAIKALGLSMEKLKTEGAHQALLDVADAFKKFPDGAEKAGIASALFTSTLGMNLIPVLDEGKAGIQALEAEASKLGFTLTEKDAKAADETFMAFQQLSAEMRGMEMSAGRTLFPSLIFLGELLSRDGFAVTAFKDRLAELGLEWSKLATFADPETLVFGGGLRKAIQKEIDQFATDESVARADMQRGLQSLTIPGIGGAANGMLKLPGLAGMGGAKGHIDRVADSIRSLKEELTGLSEGPVARGVAHLRDLGASNSQLAQGAAILASIAHAKAAKKSQEENNEALAQYVTLQKSLAVAISGASGPQKEYNETMERLNALAQKGVDITQAAILAKEKYRQELMSGMGLPSGLPIPQEKNTMAGWGQPQFGALDKLHSKAAELGSTMQSSFTGMIETGQGFTKILQGLTTQLSDFLLKAIVFKQLSNAFGTTGLGGLVGSFFGGLAGGRASGGPVTAGSLYMVGEQGPELFSPGASGSIIPNSGSVSAARSSGGNTYVDARGADAGVEARVMRALSVMKKQMSGQSLVATYEYQRRGGQL